KSTLLTVFTIGHREWTWVLTKGARAKRGRAPGECASWEGFRGCAGGPSPANVPVNSSREPFYLRRGHSHRRKRHSLYFGMQRMDLGKRPAGAHLALQGVRD